MEVNGEVPAGFTHNPIHFFALGCGSGLAKKAPGTWGTLLGMLLFLSMSMNFPQITILYQSIFVAVAFLIGIWICGITADDLNSHDHGSIVWDEFVGIWMTMLVVPHNWFYIVAAFLLFRVFDILKPWPIGWIDSRVSGGLGIMLDDVLAAGFAMTCILGFEYSLVGLGIQL